ncbi:MAG TPA: nitrilase-related carbon-nitrogen hydrolase [Candidatus Binatia bacterium]|nr:nitrilase-related carbon-nitrogen hydrolase [Candidatus Binatia bacterium]
MPRIAGVQFSGHVDRAVNVDKAIRLVRQAAARGARIICLPELFSTMYFCVERRREYFEWAEPIPGPTVERMAEVARDTGTVIICPIFERTPDGAFYNAAAVIGPDGRVLGTYRKASIPFMDRARSAEPRGDEKFFFAPGDLGFPTFDTPFARIGILICYDRHFPEAARVLGLGGAQIVFVPTNTTRMARYLWDVELRAHAIANVYYVCGVNKVGVDVGGSARDHHGDSLICNPRGEILAQASATQDDIVMADVDLSVIPELAGLWGYYRDRRPDLYGPVAEMPDAAVAPGAPAPGAGRAPRQRP